ncbi:MAG: GNAT family N-acetyltransferase [Acidimicrobiia bacterium]|nr:GNAT family N-acetyltransferase [Acidimicrobiia bacterium]MDH3469848.1 GNAT family N-acetyltransferase [Acidimicrobiia bacterium]
MATTRHLDDDRSRLDIDFIHRFLSEDAYWAKGRPRQLVENTIKASAAVVGACHDGDQVGFARVVSDGAAIAYLADVFVAQDHRGKGLGKALVKQAVENGPFANLRWALYTEDAHSLYEQYGFRPPSDRFMERPKP